MDIVTVGIRKLSEEIELPKYQTLGSSGADIRSNEDVVINSREHALVSTGLYLSFMPVGYEIQIRSRSGLAAKHGVFVLNSPGTIDSDYRGEIKVILMNLGKTAFEIKKGDRIGQLVLAPVSAISFKEMKELTPSQRGEGGFGSTGKE